MVAVLSIACVAMLSSCQGKNNKELYAGADGDYQYNSLEYTELVDYIDIDISSWQKTKNKIVGDEYEKKD